MEDEVLNRKYANAARRDEFGPWYVLDNAAMIFPVMSDRVSTYLFRLAATIKEPVHVPSLAAALTRIAPRFPYYRVELRRGFFWNYLQPLEKTPVPVSDGRYPVQDFDVRRRRQFPFRVRARGNKIALEMHHVLSDGGGALIFFKTLLAQYFRLRGVESDPAPDVFDPDSAPHPEEYEDAYNRYFRSELPMPEPRPQAFRIHSPLLPPYLFRVTTGIFPVDKVKETAKSFGVSVTELFCAAIMDALQDIRASYPAWMRRRTGPMATLEVPINMRKIYPSRTMRNFSLYYMPSVDLRLGRYDFGELAELVHHRIKSESPDREIPRQIARNVGMSRKRYIRVLPLGVKEVFMRFFYNSMGKNY
ncbi:MAG TPA: hypothetical protein VLH39_04820, partial [Magnetospirillaceae bacterium]|nr:hypothetical protein [Magnetospirillaceae bacterium]